MNSATALTSIILAMMAGSCVHSSDQRLASNAQDPICARTSTAALVVDRATILGIFGKPDLIDSKRTAKSTVAMDFDEINSLLKGDEVFMYFTKLSATEHLCFGFDEGVLVDVAYIDFAGKLAKARGRTETALHEANVATWFERRRDQNERAAILATSPSSCLTRDIEQSPSIRECSCVRALRFAPPLILDRAGVVGIFGRPDRVCSKATPELGAEMDSLQINKYLTGTEIFEYFMGPTDNPRFCLGFSNGRLVDVAILGFSAKNGEAISRNVIDALVTSENGTGP